MLKKILVGVTSALGIVAIGFVAVTGQRFYHNFQRKRETVNTYAIQNIKTGMAIRVYNAGIPDETKIIQYKHANWECMTWQLIKLEGDTYLLKNLYTHKTFQPSTEPKEGVALWQMPLEANQYQYWDFIKQDDETYLIQLKDTELYITVSSDESDAAIILMPLQNSSGQQWRLVEQHPIV